jgi:S1-C subfamily serine protease
VRLSIADPNGRSTGTGTIVDTRNGMALVLTCGHVFRESQGQGAITISVFTAGPNGAEVRGEVQGVLIDYDLERDLALVRFETASPVEVTPIAPPGTLLLPGAPIVSVGCNHGDNPTARSSNITTVNRYQGYPNVEIAGAPVEGRSGGGLFNAQGQLIGVCYAAEPEGDEGLFVALKSIHDKLDGLQLAAVYQSPSTGNPPAQATQIAASDAPGIEVRGQDPGVPPSQMLAGPAPGATDVAAAAAAAAPVPTPAAAGPITAPFAAPPATPQSAQATVAAVAAVATLTPQERATLEEIASRSGGGEVICIIRPQSPEGRSDVIKLSGVSPAFVRALTQAAGDATVQVDGSAVPAMAAAPSGNALR